LLPAFVSYYLGPCEEGYAEQPLARRAFDGLYIGLLVTVGFVIIFGLAGVVLSAGLQVMVKYIPFLGTAVGVGLILLGVWLLAGKALPLSIPTPQLDLQARNAKTVFLYGVAYAFASLSCTLPIFLAVIGASLTTAGPAGGVAMFGAYAAGMASVLMAIALSMAILKGAVAQKFRVLLPYVNRIGAALLVVAGVYLIWFQSANLSLALAGL
jgi:cytochrome c biogenesis protein CcdA